MCYTEARLFKRKPHMVFLFLFVLGKPLELECRVQFGFERVSPMRVTWKRNNKENINENLNQETR